MSTDADRIPTLGSWAGAALWIVSVMSDSLTLSSATARANWLRRCLAALALLPAIARALDPDGSEAQVAPPGQTSQRESDAAPARQLERIVVTAQKRSERLQEVPLPIASIDPEILLERNALTARDYLTRVPGVALNEVGSGQSQLIIRGIATGYGGNPLVGITIDDVPFGSSVFTSLGCCILPELDPWLLDRIEVLRGPQGTLYGANAMGGLLKFVTTTPSLTRSTAGAELDASTVAHGNEGYGIRAAYGTPLRTDQLAVQVSALHRRDPGYIRDSLQDRPNVNEAHLSGGHLAIGGKLTELLNMRLTALYQERSTGGSNMVDIALSGAPLYGPYEHRRMPGTDGLDTHLQFHSLDLTAKIGSVSLTSLTGYQRHFFANPTDETPGFGGLLPRFYPGVTDLGIRLENTIHTDRWTQEFRVVSPNDARVQYVAGLFYSAERNRVTQRLLPATFTSGESLTQLPILYDSGIKQDFKQYAAFANVTLGLTDRFDISAGGRYSHNEQDIFQTRAGLIARSPTVSASDTDDPTTYSFAARYRFDPDRMLYARVASGYRAGGPNFNFPPGRESFQPDKTVNYEFGLKTQWLDRQLTFNPAVYYIEWSRIQVLQTSPTGISYFTNAGKASSKGIELALDYQPVASLRIAGNVAYNDGKLDEDAPPNTFFGSAGDRLPFTADWTANFSADYRWPVTAAMSILAGVTAAYTGARLIDFAPAAGTPRLELPAFTTIDLRVGLSKDRLRATFFVRNVGDKRGYVGGTNATGGPSGPWTAALVAPRTVGVALTLDL